MLCSCDGHETYLSRIKLSIHRILERIVNDKIRQLIAVFFFRKKNSLRFQDVGVSSLSHGSFKQYVILIASFGWCDFFSIYAYSVCNVHSLSFGWYWWNFKHSIQSQHNTGMLDSDISSQLVAFFLQYRKKTKTQWLTSFICVLLFKSLVYNVARIWFTILYLTQWIHSKRIRERVLWCCTDCCCCCNETGRMEYDVVWKHQCTRAL